jgi:hypothetical protein
MTEALFIVLALAGACSLAFAFMAFAANYALPYLASKPWRTHRRPAATRRAR